MQADAMVEAVLAVLASDCWELTRGDDPSSDPYTPRYVDHAKDGIDVSVKYKVGVTDSVEDFARAQSTDHPRDQQVLRSTMDPGYGKSSGYYPDGEWTR